MREPYKFRHTKDFVECSTWELGINTQVEEYIPNFGWTKIDMKLSEYFNNHIEDDNLRFITVWSGFDFKK